VHCTVRRRQLPSIMVTSSVWHVTTIDGSCPVSVFLPGDLGVSWADARSVEILPPRLSQLTWHLPGSAGVIIFTERVFRDAGELRQAGAEGLKRVRTAGEGEARAAGDVPWRGVQELAGWWRGSRSDRSSVRTTGDGSWPRDTGSIEAADQHKHSPPSRPIARRTARRTKILEEISAERVRIEAAGS